jgi:hypothetical protein
MLQGSEQTHEAFQPGHHRFGTKQATASHLELVVPIPVVLL